MKHSFFALALIGFAATAQAASVTLPDVSSLSEADARSLIKSLAEVNVITSNCPAYNISDAEWTLITGTGDKLAAQLGLDPARYDQTYYGPAFKLLDDPASCDRIGPNAAPLLDRLKGMGGAAN